MVFVYNCMRLGGAEQIAYDLIRGLDRQTFRPVLCCLHDLGELGRRLQAEGIRTYDHLVDRRRPGWSVLRVASILKREKAGILYVPNGFHDMVVGRMAALLVHTPQTVLIVHSYDTVMRQTVRPLRRALLEIADRLFHPLFHRVIALTDAHKRYLASTRRIRPSKISVVYNGIDLRPYAGPVDANETRRRYNIPDGAKVIAIVANLLRWKAHDMFLKAASLVHREAPQTIFVVAGSGPEHSRLERLADELGIADHVRFLGAVENVPELLHAVDLSVLTSTSEAFPLAMLEAMAAALPVVATDVGSVSEIVEDGVNGFLVPCGATEQFAGAMLRVLKDPALARRFGQAGRRKVESRFTADRMVRRSETLFRRWVEPTLPARRAVVPNQEVISLRPRGVPKRTGTKTPCLVLGCHKSGLGVIRALGERGVPVVAVCYSPRDMGHVSRHVIARYRGPNPDESARGFVDFLLRLARRWPGSVLLPTDDATVIPTSKHRDELREHFKVVANDWSVTEKYIVKKHTYALAEASGVPCPRTLVPSSVEEAADFTDQIGFPCLLKPSVGHRFFDLFRTKMIVLGDRGDLQRFYRLAERAGVEMMVQELIPGDDRQGANYNSFFLAGQAVCEFTADKVRLAPPGIGFPRVVVSRGIPEIRHWGRKILEALDYTGFSCIEFKRDARDGVYKLMEVNGRQNLSSALAVHCGMNFPYMAYCHALDGSVPRPAASFEEGVFWIDLERDLVQSLLSFRRERFSWEEYIRPYRRKHVFAVWSRRDPAPFAKRLADVCFRGPPHAVKKIRARLAGAAV